MIAVKCKVKCEESARCDVGCKHESEHEEIDMVSRFGGHSCQDEVHYCDYLKRAVHCKEVE